MVLSIECPVIDILCNWPKTGKNQNRVMPLSNEKKLCNILKRNFCNFEINSQYLFVSGYFEIKISLRSAKDRKTAKKQVKKAIQESGGFMSLNDWLLEKNRTRTMFIKASGSGKNINVSTSNNQTFL